MSGRRKNFEEILKNAKVDIPREYLRLYKLMYGKNIYYISTYKSLHQLFNIMFPSFDIRGTAIDLNDFDETYGFSFSKDPDSIILNDLILFCEYFYNLLSSFQRSSVYYRYREYVDAPMLSEQITRIIDKVSYKLLSHGNITIFVPNSPGAVAVAEITDDDISYNILRYNHYSLKGDIKEKGSILVKIAKALEPKRKDLDSINFKLSSDLFFIYNCANIRHNNKDSDKNGFTQLSDAELESVYDDAYQMSLLAFLLLDNVSRSKRIEKLKMKSSK